MSSRKLLVTHHAPDLDAVGAVWLLKRFDAQHYADAKVAFVNPGETLTLEEAETFDCQLHDVTHVDTGLGEFDHHQPDRGQQYLSASLLVYRHLCKIHPELTENKALAELAEFITEIDHLGEVFWPEAGHLRYTFMIHELIRGIEFYDPHNDDSQLHFGMMCLDAAYANVVSYVKALEIIESESITIELPVGKCLAVETSNDGVIKLAQKQGYVLVVRKDPKLGHVRIKARPDVSFSLKELAEQVKKLDTKGSWYYHPSGKMLINGSSKHRNQVPSPLSLDELIAIVREVWHVKNPV